MSRLTKQCSSGTSLDFIFRTPKKLEFDRLYRYYFDYILRLLYRVIIIDNVPETVDETFLKLILYTQGKVCFLRGNVIGEGEELLALNCSRADTPNVYYIPHKVLVANPRLNKSYNITPGEDCELVYLSEADVYHIGEFGGGLYEYICRTATMLADNDISINIAQKNTRLTNIISGDTQNTVDSIKAVITAMYAGDPSIVVRSSLIDKLQGIPILDNGQQQNLVQLIQVNQYILSHFFEQIGLCTHDNLKKERLITAEVNDNVQLALINIDDIIYSLNKGFDKVNAMFGCELRARLNPIIEQQQQEETAPEQEPELEDQSEVLDEEAEPEDQIEEPEEEAAPEEDDGAEISESDVSIEISGDNNTIIIGGGEVNADDTTQDAPEDMDRDNGGGGSDGDI